MGSITKPSASAPKIFTAEDYEKAHEKIANEMPDEESKAAYKLFIKGQVKEIKVENERLKNSGIDILLLACKISDFARHCNMKAVNYALLQKASAERRQAEQTERKDTKLEFTKKALELAMIAAPMQIHGEQTPELAHAKAQDPRDQLLAQAMGEWEKNLKDIPLGGSRRLHCERNFENFSGQIKEHKRVHDAHGLSNSDSAQVIAKQLARHNEIMARDCGKKDVAEELMYDTKNTFDGYLESASIRSKAACEKAVIASKKELENSYASLKPMNPDQYHVERLARPLIEELEHKCPREEIF